MTRKFLVDAMLGKLARFLRIFGFDTIYADDLEEYFQTSPVPDEKLLEYALKDDRIIITKDFPFHKLAGDKSIYVEGDGIYSYMKQLKEKLDLVYNFDMNGARCSVCNGTLKKVSKQSIKDQLKPQTLKYYDDFYQCLKCGKVYWKGSHIEKIIKELKDLQK